MPDVSAKIKGLNVEFNDNLTTSPNIDSGDDIKTSFARIHKRFSQMKSGAYIDASISNNKTITLGDSNIGVVSISQNQGLTDIEKTNARTNIGAGTSNFSGSFNNLTNKPTTLSGYGITDAKINNGVITLGSNSLTPITSLKTFICTCSTPSSTPQKELTTESDFNLVKGTTILVKNTYTNNIQNVTLNVNNTGAKQIYYNGEIVTSISPAVTGQENRNILYIYDGTYWVWIGMSYYYSYVTMTQSQANAGTATTGRLISAKVLSDTITNKTDPMQLEINYSINTGAKNLLRFESAGTYGEKTYTTNGITFTLNETDMTITATGTATGNAYAYLRLGETSVLIDEFCNGKYTLTGCPEGGSTSTYRMYVGKVGYRYDEFGSGIVLPDRGSISGIYVAPYVSNGFSIPSNSPLVFKPMIRASEIIDSTYYPYAPTNRELYEMILALQNERSVQSVNSLSTLNLRRNELNESLDTDIESLDSTPEGESESYNIDEELTEDESEY